MKKNQRLKVKINQTNKKIATKSRKFHQWSEKNDHKLMIEEECNGRKRLQTVMDH